MVETIGLILFFFCVLAGFAFWIVAVHGLVRAAQNLKPGFSFRQGFSLIYVLFMPGRYTELGLHYRRRVVVGLLGFLAAWICGVAVGTLTGAAHWSP